MEPPLLFLGPFYATTILLKLPNMFPTTNLSKPPTLVTFSLYASVARLLLFYPTIVIFVCFDDSLEEYVRQRDIARGSSRARLRHDRSRFSVVRVRCLCFFGAEAVNVHGQRPIPGIVVLINLINPADISAGRTRRLLCVCRVAGCVYGRKSDFGQSNADTYVISYQGYWTKNSIPTKN